MVLLVFGCLTRIKYGTKREPSDGKNNGSDISMNLEYEV